jgi:ferredoxin/flavodoxin---NADP+ reductase
LKDKIPCNKMTSTTRKKKELFPVKVIANREITTGVFVIELERSFDFIAGQVIAIALAPDDEPRLYSIASGANRDYIRILFDVNPLGELTPPLSKIASGATLYISKPFGKFIASEAEAWWIATGTGIAPFISMAESGFATNKTLLHGARYIRQFYFSDYFEKVQDIKYMKFCTGESAPGVISGRLTSFLRESNDITDSRMYYLCGNAEMVVDVRDILIGKGVPYEKIIAEIYF